MDDALTARLRTYLERDRRLGDAEWNEGPPATGDEVLAALRALMPAARERQRALGIPDDVIEDTLRDVDRKHADYGAHTEVPWLMQILRGDVIELGRLQVERVRGAQGHGLHIPASGPLTPEAVDDSLRRIRALVGDATLVCTSWLLDPVLVEELPESNMAAFARRFELTGPVERSDAGSAAAAKFVFRRPLAEVLDPAVVTPVTRLERLVTSRLRAGLGWAEARGVLVD